MKSFPCIVLAMMLSSMLMAQEVVPKRGDNYLYGLYNKRTSQWVTKCVYQDINTLSSWNGVFYYSAQRDNLWGLLNDRGKVATSFVYEALAPDIGFCENGFFIAKKDGSQGVVDAYNHVIIPFKYKKIYLYSDAARLILWDSKEQSVRMDKMVETRNQLLKNDKEEAEMAAKIRAEEMARKKKEQELSSFTAYAKSFVEPKVNAWQKKGEFEKMSDYQRRVTGPNRTAMIDSLTHIAEQNFIAEHASLKPESFPMMLDVYDSENEVFFIQSSKLGKMVVPVPINDGPVFKSHFNDLARRNPVFYIEDDKIALASMDFYDEKTGKTFHYSNSNALSYNHYDMNPDSYKFELVSVVTAKTVQNASSEQNAPINRPVVTILSPAANSTYTDSNMVIRYQVTTDAGANPVLTVWVNGEEVEWKAKNPAQTKGVAPAWKEIELNLPKDRDRACNIMLSVIDDRGLASEPKTVSLGYVGSIPKPNLNIFAVGVGNYQSKSLTKLGYAAKDAADFINTICASDASMYNEINSPVLLTDCDATKANIERELDRFSRSVKQDDVVMLFFSGHGVRDDDDAYFMSVDADGDAPYTGVDFSYIRKRLRNMKNNKCKVLIFMDTCYSGAMYSTKSSLKDITFSENDIIGLYSSNSGQTSAEISGYGNGLFTKALLDGMRGAAKDEDGDVTIYKLQEYISKYVSEHTGGSQSPIIENRVGDFVIYKVK